MQDARKDAGQVVGRERTYLEEWILSRSRDDKGSYLELYRILKIRTREPVFRILLGSFRGYFGQKTRSYWPPIVKIGQKPGLSDPEDSDSTHP